MKALSTAGVLILTAIGLIAGAVIASSGHPVPDQLWTLDTVLVGASAGVTIPTNSTTKGSE